MILVDLSHMFFRQFFMNIKNIVVTEQNEFGEHKPTGEINGGFLIHIIYNNLLAFSNKFGGSRENPIVVCCDSKPSWRHAFYVENSKDFPEYKGETYKGDRTKHEEYPWEKIWEALNDGMTALEQFTDIIVLKVDLCEADDIIAVLAQDFGVGDTFVCSSDKDFRQLQNETTHQYDPVKKLIVPPIDVQRYKELHFLTAGDDNIKQVKKGVGIKTAEKMLKELDIILQTNPDIKARYEFNKTLIDFDRIPSEVREAVHVAYSEVLQTNFQNHSPGQLLTFFSKKAMRQMATRIPEFKLQPTGRKFRVPKKEEHLERVETSIVDFFNS